MSETDEQGRLAALNIGFGSALPNSPAAAQLETAFRMLIVGDFGGRRPDGAPSGLTLRGDAPASLPEQLDVTIECTVENLLGSEPDRLELRLPVKRLGGFTPRALNADVQMLARAQSLRQMLANGHDGFETFADLDKLVAAARGASEPAPETLSTGEPATAPASDASLLQSIIGAHEPAPASGCSSALSSLIGAIAQPAGQRVRTSLKERVNAVDALIARQLDSIRAQPRFAAIEAVWRGLQLLLRVAGHEANLQIDLLDIAEAAATECLLTEVVPDELEQLDRAPLNCVLVLGQVSNNVEGVERLAYCAAAGAALQVPVIVSLQQGFFDDLSEETAAAWSLLRHDDHAQWLAACHGDLVLDATDRAAPLWGEPGWPVAALIASSVARTGWPTDLTDANGAVVDGLDTHEIASRGGAAAWPLRVPPGTTTLARLRALGVVALAAQPNRDWVFLSAAPTVGAATSGGEPANLGDYLLSALLQARLRVATLVVGARSDEEIANAIGTVLFGVLGRSGKAQVGVKPLPHDAPGAPRCFRIEVRTGLNSRQVAFDYRV